MASRYRFELDGEIHNIVLNESDQGFSVVLDEIDLGIYDVTIEGLPGLFSMLLNEEPTKAYVQRDGRNYDVTIGDRTFSIQEALGNQRSRSNVGSRQDPIGIISTPLAGIIVEIKLTEGDTFSAGQVILIVEAMKMQNEIQSPISGKITSIRFKPGDRVESGDVVVEYDEVDG